MSDFIGFDISGVQTIAERIKRLPKEAADAGVEEANGYIVEFERTYPKSRKGQPFAWSSEKQRKFVMAKLRRENNLPYSRTQQLRRGWKTVGKGSDQIVVNEVPYAKWVKQKATMIKGHVQRGWTALEDDIRQRARTILKRFEGGVEKVVRKMK